MAPLKSSTNSTDAADSGSNTNSTFSDQPSDSSYNSDTVRESVDYDSDTGFVVYDVEEVGSIIKKDFFTAIAIIGLISEGVIMPAATEAGTAWGTTEMVMFSYYPDEMEKLYTYFDTA